MYMVGCCVKECMAVAINDNGKRKRSDLVKECMVECCDAGLSSKLTRPQDKDPKMGE